MGVDRLWNGQALQCFQEYIHWLHRNLPNVPQPHFFGHNDFSHFSMLSLSLDSRKTTSFLTITFLGVDASATEMPERSTSMHVNLGTRFVVCLGLSWKGSRRAAEGEKWLAAR